MNLNTNKPIKILVVDDEKHILRIVKLNLKRSGYEVLTASNGKEAIETAIMEQPDLILLDIMMPIMSGFEVCQKLKEDKTTSHIPIIFLTARGAETDKLKAKELGVAAYLTKPFSRNLLLRNIKEKLKMLQDS